MSSNKNGPVRAIMILEVIGRPPEHLVETLGNLIEKIGEEKGVCVVDKKINEPIFMKLQNSDENKSQQDLAKEQKDFYSSFAEIEVEVEEVLQIAMLMFKYMPAHIEIIEPEYVSLTNNGMNEVFNEIVRRLHSYDEIARILEVEKNILEKKLREIAEREKKEREE